ncbi:dihydroxy-acid dehydratase [Defluviitalea saccharophila]|uniref:Dihydroxy-acid dehydratase n=1 Tax=Defluviitalea saccharophila TaxID=879970 RepID=A0ABZ2Y353_9FIRM
MYKSQQVRDIAPEVDALRMGMGWSVEDTNKPHIIIESTYGDSHPGSAGLDRISEYVEKSIASQGAKYSKFYATDICDGIAQGHEGMNYSLLSREMIANMVEIHVKAAPCDGLVCISSCDKAVPAHLIAMARLDMPSIFVSGGVMREGPDHLTLEQIGTYNIQYKRGEITEAEFNTLKQNACASCGACQFMGTACTMQVMSEALGLSLLGSSMIPYGTNILFNAADQAGKQVVELMKKGIKPSDILTYSAFHNALVIHSAISGSTNALLHLPVIAKEAGVKIGADLFDNIQRDIPYLVNVRPAGKYSGEHFYYAGGVPGLMLKLSKYLDLQVLTVSGKNLGESLEEYKESNKLITQQNFLMNYGLKSEEVIRPLENPITEHGAIAVLKGNIAPDGCVIKHTALHKDMRLHTGRARVFENELDARNAIINRDIKEGEVIVIRYVGPKGAGMPEMFYATEALVSDEQLSSTTALITDGRFSGASRGPVIGHISPEAAEGGPIAFVTDNDLIEINIDHRSINIVGINGVKMTQEEIVHELEERKKLFKKPEIEDKGILGLYKKTATSAMEGGAMEIN